MIKTFIFVEDGSVDLDELKSSVGEEVLVVTYRQGTTPPQIQQPGEPVQAFSKSLSELYLEVNDLIVCTLRGDYCKISKKLRKKFETLYSDYFA